MISEEIILVFNLWINQIYVKKLFDFVEAILIFDL